MGVTQVPGKQVLDGSVTDADVAAANKDGLASVPSMRTLGTSAQQAAAGNDSRFAMATQGLIILKDRKASGTHGGGTTASVWTRRQLTFKDTDTNGDVVTFDNTTNVGQFVLAAGTYEIDAVCPVANCTAHQTRLRNITANAGAGLTLVNGSSGYANVNSVSDRSFLIGSFTVAAGQTLEIQHIVAATVETVGFGGAAITGEFEVYTQARIRRLS